MLVLIPREKGYCSVDFGILFLRGHGCHSLMESVHVLVLSRISSSLVMHSMQLVFEKVIMK